MNEIFIKYVHENELNKIVYNLLFLTSIEIYILYRIVKRHDNKIKNLESYIKENNMDKSKGE